MPVAGGAAAARPERVSTLELFFDLVFVFVFTQLTALLAKEPSGAGLAKVVVLLLVTWWMYDGYAWLTNALSLDVVGNRLLLLGGMAGFLIMALAVPTTFEGGGVAFAAGYLAVVLLHGGLYLRETSESESQAIRGIAPYNVVAALLILSGTITGGAAQWVLFAAAATLLWSSPLFTSTEGFLISAAHFVERHALVVIVALGESIVVLGAGAGGAEVGTRLATIALLALALSAGLWWTYFGEEEQIAHGMGSAPAADRPRLALVFGYLHAALLLGIVLLAAGLKKAIGHPLDALAAFPAVELAVGTALFVGATAVLLRALGIAQRPARGVATVAAPATIPLGLAVSAMAQVAALAAIVTAALVADHVSPHAARRGREPV